MSTGKAIVVGSGIVGLAITRALVLKGFSVELLDRSAKATGASVRNFGMVWPIGQPLGHLYERALYSRSVWQDLAGKAGFWYETAGSLHLAYDDLETEVMHSFFDQEGKARDMQWLSPSGISAISPAAVASGLKGGLYSSAEIIIDPREAIQSLNRYYTEQQKVTFHPGCLVTGISGQIVHTSGGDIFEGDLVVVCSGADFETLYPELFKLRPMVKCKLQMMRTAIQPEGWRIGPALCGGLSLIHYSSFRSAPGLDALKKYYEEKYPEYLKWGIHVMAAQNGRGEITVGDSHEYAGEFDPFDRLLVNELILDYLRKMARFRDEKIAESWHGIYPKMSNGATELVLTPEEGVYIVNGLGGAGMTLSFGLADEVVTKIF